MVTPVVKREAGAHLTLFRNLAHARELMADWVTDYNTERPHSALGPAPRRVRPASDNRNRPTRCAT